MRSNEQLLQEVLTGKGYFDIDLDNLKDVHKLAKIIDWLDRSGKLLHKGYIERLEKHLAEELEKGIKDGRYSPGWRRSGSMDKETWCSAVERTMGVYDRAARIIESINHLKRANVGFQSDALEHLPPQVKIKRNSDGGITEIDFGGLLTDNVSLESNASKQKIDPLVAWCDKYEKIARDGMKDGVSPIL